MRLTIELSNIIQLTECDTNTDTDTDISYGLRGCLPDLDWSNLVAPLSDYNYERSTLYSVSYSTEYSVRNYTNTSTGL